MVSFPSKLPVWGSRRGSLLSSPPVFPRLLRSYFVVYGRLCPHPSPKSSAWNRTKKKEDFLLCLSSHLHSHRFHRCFGPTRSSPLHLHHLFFNPPPVFVLSLSRLFLSLCCGTKSSTCHPWSPCRCPQPGAEAGACQQPRCICNSSPLWYPCYVRWSGWGLVLCRSKVVSTLEKL